MPAWKPQAAYDVPELAAAARMPVKRLRRLLASLKVPLQPGRPQWVWAADLAEQAPRLWASLDLLSRGTTPDELLRALADG